jgi:ArsR family transcriptional regulator, arsenate/arsenite/antimonite-responsive transcriptional repressor
MARSSSDATAVTPACCPLPPGVEPLATAPPEDGGEARRLAAVAKALGDPIRLRMLALMTRARDRHRLRPDAAAGRALEGVCVCEFQSLHGLAQSKVSYHLRVLRDAGLVRETRRGKWSFYTIDEATAGDALAELGERLGL